MRTLWFPLWAPPAAWAIQEWLGWYFGQRVCNPMAASSVRWIVLSISIALLIVTVLGIRTSVSGLRAPHRAIHAAHRDRVDFMAFGGLLVSSIFAIAIVWAALAPVFLGNCGWMR